MHMLLIRQRVGALIGKEGGTIKGITTASGCKVWIHKDPFPGTLEQAVTMTGSPLSLNSAVKLMINQLENEEESTRLRFIVNEAQAGGIIGKSGAVVTEMRGESGASIVLDQFQDERRLLTLHGPKAAVIKAHLLIAEKLVKIPDDKNLLSLGTFQRTSGLLGGPLKNPIQGYMSQGYASPQGYALQGHMPQGYALQGYAQGNALHENAQHIPSGQYEEWIPNELVGALIGRRGENVKELNKMSQAHIKFEKGEPESMKSKMIISGSRPAVQIAIGLVAQRLMLRR